MPNDAPLLPPVRARLVPARTAIGMLARFAFWPLAFVAASSLSPAFALLLAPAFIVVTLIASTLQRGRAARVAQVAVALAAIVVGFASAAVSAEALRGMGLTAPWTAMGAAAVGVLTGACFLQATAAVKPMDAEPFDAHALALAPAALWLALVSVQVRFGAEAIHLHRNYPKLAVIGAGLAIPLALVAVVTLARQRRWTERAYRHVVPDGAARRVPSLAAVDGDAVIAPEPADETAYRSHREPLARVPASPETLRAYYTRRLRWGLGALVASVVALVLVTGARATIAHGRERDLVPATLPPLPGTCASAPPALRFVALEPLTALDLEVVAARYRRAGIPDARVESPLRLDPAFVDPRGGKLVAEEIAHAARRAHPLSREHFIVVTDRDMYSRVTHTNYVFAAPAEGLAVVSVARMDTAFPWFAAPSAPSCAPRLHERAYKMITRQIVRHACHADPTLDPRSIRRAWVMSLDDLDAMDERVF